MIRKEHSLSTRSFMRTKIKSEAATGMRLVREKFDVTPDCVGVTTMLRSVMSEPVLL